MASMTARIFLLEDDIELSDTLAAYLQRSGFDVVQSFDAQTACEQLYESHFDLLLLDVNLPFQNGFELLARLRESGDDTPAVFITARHGADDATFGFDAGADDYIRKPFALKELLARIHAVIKRRYNTQSHTILIGPDMHFDPKNYTLHIRGERIALKPKEARLLALLLRRANHAVTKQEIFDTLWAYGETPNEGSLRTFVKILRKHLGKSRIETVKEVGYRYVSL